MKEWNELSEFSKQIINDLDELNASILEAKEKALKLAHKLYEAAPMHESAATIQECAENAGWIEMCLDHEVDEHIYNILKLINKVD